MRCARPTPKPHTASLTASRSASPPCQPLRGWPMQAMHSRIAGTGSYLPEEILTNAELARRVDSSDEWIRSRTGICQRHIAASDEATSDLALHASRKALEAAG